MENPKIRFKGYTKDWEQRKLGDVIDDMYNGQTPSRNKSEYWNGTIKWLSSGELNRGTVYDSIETITEEGQKAANLKIVPKGTFVMAITGLEAAGTRGNCALLGFDTTLNQSCMALFPKQEMLTSEFLFQWYRKVGEEYGINYTQGTKQQSYNAELIKILPISLPSVVEQRKISSYLSHLDHLITLHQRKCEQTKKLKKYMLQKMFPQNGAKVPEIRFDGFTYDWEQRKLGDLVDRVTRKNQDLVSELPLTISAQYGLIDQNEFFDKRVASKDVSGYYLIEKGEFAYNKSTSTDAPWGAIKRLDRYENGVLSTLYIVFGIKENNPVDSDFLVSYYSTNLWHKGIHEIAAEGARNHGLLNITPADFFETRLMIPQDIEEQKKIGKYFIELEALITLHQRKCDELKKMKKYMLQNMFI